MEDRCNKFMSCRRSFILCTIDTEFYDSVFEILFDTHRIIQAHLDRLITPPQPKTLCTTLQAVCYPPLSFAFSIV